MRIWTCEDMDVVSIRAVESKKGEEDSAGSADTDEIISGSKWLKVCRNAQC